jgi:FkbM family methyltransferase
MVLRDRLVFHLIGTPLQGPIERLRSRIARWRKPALLEIHLEQDRIFEVMARSITDGMNCIDVGCHLGSVLREMVRLSPHGQHIAIEPLAYKAGWLRTKYPQVTVHQVALGEHEGTADFDWNPSHSGFSALNLKGSRNGPAQHTLQVQVKRLDDLVPASHAVGFIKVDVEGGEIPVLRGARRILAENRPRIVFECTRSGLSRFGLTAPEVFDFLNRELDYRIYLIKDWLAGQAPMDLPRMERAMVYPFQAFNFLAVPVANTAG